MATGDDFGSIGHLATRFVSSLSPAGPQPADEAWARGWLLPGEVELWERMSGPDRRHALGVAREALGLLDGDPGDPGGPGDRNPCDRDPGADGGGDQALRAVVAAALLHDVGKVEAGLGTWARAAVTAAAMVVGRRRLAAWGAAGSRGARRRVGAYLAHDRLGERMLREAGSSPLTAAWAGEHHMPAQRWSLDARVAGALKQADGD